MVSTRVHPVRWLRAHPFTADALLGAALAAVSVPALWLGQSNSAHYRRPDAVAVLLVLSQTLPLAWRRRQPTRVLAIVGVSAVVFEAFGFPSTGATIGVLVALYTTASSSRQRSIVAAAVTAVCVSLALLVSRSSVTAADVAANTLVFSTAWILGDRQRTRRAYTAELEHRAERLERERFENARQAVAEERTRIARELHDVVAHNVSVMVVQAGAARRTIDRDPSAAVESMRLIEVTGRQALDEMRRLLGVLRSERRRESPAMNPQPTVTEIGALVDQVREAGLRVELEIVGEPKAVASGVDLSAYRIVQEALTNTLKHAGPAAARVRIAYGESDLEVQVVDDGRGAAESLVAKDGAHHGLVGMRERVALYGGELEVGPRRGGGYQVKARLPLAPARP